MTRGRISAVCYAETYPGIGVGAVAEWVSHHQRGAGTLEVAVVLPFINLKAELIVHPRQVRVRR